MSIPYSRYIFGSLPWYGTLIVCGLTVAIILCSIEEKRRHLPQDTVIDLAFWVIPSGLIGARLYYVVFQWSLFADDPLSILRIWEGGLAIYGGVIGGFIGIMIFSRKRKLNPAVLTDMIVPGLALAQAIGRWGNYFNMEAYGKEVINPSLHFFPFAVQILHDGEYVWHHATFFYESCLNITIFLLLWFLARKRSKTPGTVTLCYFLLYGLGRSVIEGFRTDSLMLGSFRISQLLSAVLFILSAAILLFRFIHYKKK